MNCPKCKSDRVQRLEFYLGEKKEAKKGTNNLVGCLVIIVLLVFVPVAFLVPAFASLTWLSSYIWPICLVLAGILIYFQYQTKKAQKDLFVCLVCGERFPVVFVAPDDAEKEKKS